MSNDTHAIAPKPLTPRGRYLILAAAFLGWLFAGTQMAITPLVNRSVILSLLWAEQGSAVLTSDQKGVIGVWLSRNLAAFLCGAAAGGLLLGWAGDRNGRTRAMGFSILLYSVPCAMSYFISTPLELLILRFFAGLGVGGMWPNGIAIVSEVWSGVSRLALAGIIGTAANVGIVMMGVVGIYYKITPEDWRWVMLVASAPGVLGLIVLAVVPESPRWLAARAHPPATATVTPVREVFQPPLLTVTMVGILLGTVPLLGGWGSGNWLIAWADDAGAFNDPVLKAWTQVNRGIGGMISSLLGGWLAGLLGRKRSYFFISLGSLLISGYIFNFLTPHDAKFGLCAFLLGFISGFYFGWMPLCLPELFPTRVRATGGGVTFNFGRIATALGILGSGALVRQFGSDYGRVGAATSLIYALGMFIIFWYRPGSAEESLTD